MDQIYGVLLNYSTDLYALIIGIFEFSNFDSRLGSWDEIATQSKLEVELFFPVSIISQLHICMIWFIIWPPYFLYYPNAIVHGPYLWDLWCIAQLLYWPVRFDHWYLWVQ